MSLTTTSEKQLITGFGIVCLLLLFYPVIVFDSVNKYNLVNLILYLVSMIAVAFSVTSINNGNIKTFNIFAIFYFSALFLNTVNLSFKQFLKTGEDLYFFLAGPFILVCVLYLVERLKVTTVKFKHIGILNVDFLYLCVLLSYVLLKLYIGMKVGFRIFNFSDISVVESGTKYTVPGLSGLSALAQWLLIIFLPYVKKRYSVVAVVSIIVLSGILNVKRGDIMRLSMFILFYFVFVKIRLQQINVMRIVQILALVTAIFLVFIVYGEYRTASRGGEAGLIVTYLGSRIDSVFISWIYSYFAFNFEVLKLKYDFPADYAMRHMSEMFGADLSREALGLRTTISGINASTFLGPFVLDYGVFYPLEIIPFSLVAGFFVYLARKLNFLGLYIFMAMLMSLLVFGDYFINRSMLMSMMTAILLFPFLKLDATATPDIKGGARVSSFH